MALHLRAAAVAVSISLHTQRSIFLRLRRGEPIGVRVTRIGDFVEAYDYSTSSWIVGELPRIFHYGASSFLRIAQVENGAYAGEYEGLACIFTVTISDLGAEFKGHRDSTFFPYEFLRNQQGTLLRPPAD